MGSYFRRKYLIVSQMAKFICRGEDLFEGGLLKVGWDGSLFKGEIFEERYFDHLRF